MKKTWYTRFNKEIEDAVKKNYNDDKRILQRKEHYHIDVYDDIVAYIDKLVSVFKASDKNPEVLAGPNDRKNIKNPEMASEKSCNKLKEI